MNIIQWKNEVFLDVILSFFFKSFFQLTFSEKISTCVCFSIQYLVIYCKFVVCITRFVNVRFASASINSVYSNFLQLYNKLQNAQTNQIN